MNADLQIRCGSGGCRKVIGRARLGPGRSIETEPRTGVPPGVIYRSEDGGVFPNTSGEPGRLVMCRKHAFLWVSEAELYAALDTGQREITATYRTLRFRSSSGEFGRTPHVG